MPIKLTQAKEPIFRALILLIVPKTKRQWYRATGPVLNNHSLPNNYTYDLLCAKAIVLDKIIWPYLPSCWSFKAFANIILTVKKLKSCLIN